MKPRCWGVLQEAARESGMERIDTSHCRGEVVDHQVIGNALEEGPGCLQPLDHIDQLLAEGRPDEAVPRVGQDDDQRPNHSAATRLRVLHQTQTAEVHLRHLAGCALSHPDRRRTPPPPAPPHDEPPHDVYETRQPRPASSSCMRGSCNRSAVSHS